MIVALENKVSNVQQAPAPPLRGSQNPLGFWWGDSFLASPPTKIVKDDFDSPARGEWECVAQPEFPFWAMSAGECDDQ